MSTTSPISVQKQIKDNATDIQAFLNDLSSWSTHMKAKELAESGADLQPMDKVPLRNDPKKQTKEKENRTTKSERMKMEKSEDENSTSDKKKISSTDYTSWEKFDVEKACDDVDKDDKKEEESEEQRIKRKAITLRLQAIAAEKKEQGNQYLKEKNYSRAIECYTEGIRCDKTNALLYSNRAQAYLFDKQYQKAVEDCTESIRHDATYVKSYFRRAKALMELQKLNEAKDNLNHALKLDPKNSEVRSLLNDLNRKTQASKPGPKKVTPSPPMFPGIRTMFTSRSNSYTPVAYDDDYDEDITKKPENNEVYPKQILPVTKPPERRSKRPLLPIHVKLIGQKDKKLRLGSEGGSLTNSLDGDSSSLGSPSSDSNVPTPPLTSLANSSSTASLPSLFSKLQMASTTVPPKPKTAAQFTATWKQIKSNPDISAHYLNQLNTNDYLIFQDSMEYSILSGILDLLVWEFLPKKWDIIKHLVGLTKIRRFSTLLMFLSEKDRANLRKLISECPPEMQELLKPLYEV